MAEEALGQVAEQPALSVEDQAAAVAKGILQSEGEVFEGDKPRDEKGKFVKQEPEQPAEVEAQTEEVAAEEQPPETPEVDWDKIKTFRKKLTVKNEAGEDEEVELSLEDMERGVMLERSYRQKTAQIARERETVQAKVKEETEKARKELDEKLQLAEQAIWHTLAPEIQGIDWNKLATEDPAEWARKYQHVQNVNAKLAQVQAERKKLSDSQAEEAKANIKKQIEASTETLKTEIPGWSDDLYRDILRSGVEQGFKKDEVNAIIDPRAIKVLWKARQYDALQKAKPVVEKRAVQIAPKVVKPGAGDKPASNDKWKEGMAKLQKTGRTEDAVELARLLVADEARQQQQKR